MKKVIALLLAVVLVMALAACGSSNSTAPAATEAPKAADTPKTDAPKADEPKADEPKTEAPAEVQWPTGDVTILVPADVGAPLDLATRVMKDYLQEKTGYNIIVENDGTGGGAKLGEKLYSAPTDGSILMYAGGGQVPPYYNGSWAHNLANPDDYTIVSSMVGLAVPSGAVVVTQPDAPYDTWADLVQYVKDNPNTIVAGAANGTPHEVRLKLLLREEGILDKVRWISGTNNDISTGLLGGSINVGMLTETAGPQFMVEGKLKGLLYSNVVRNYAGKPEVVAALDAIPTVADIYGEAKAPELTCAWPMAFCAPAGMDEALADKICEVVSSIVDSPEYMERVAALGGTNTFQDFTRAEMREMMDRVDEQCKSFYGN